MYKIIKAIVFINFFNSSYLNLINYAILSKYIYNNKYSYEYVKCFTVSLIIKTILIP